MSLAPVSSAAAAANIAATFADKPQRLSSLPHAQQVKAVAGQFEAIILRQFLSESVGKLMDGGQGGGDGAGQSGAGIYSYMLTDVLAGKMAEGGGLGLAPVLARQFDNHAGESKTTSS